MILSKNLFRIKCIIRSDDAVAEVLDFVTILGILILSFSLIGLMGYPALKSVQESRYIENTRQSFIVMAENLNKIALGQVPSRSVEIKMYGGRLSVVSKSKINITVLNSTGGRESFEQEMGSIENTVGDSVIAYEGTGVWVKYPDATLNAYRPLITNQSHVLVIPVVKISGMSSISGNGMSRVTVKGVPSITFLPNVSNITITITGDYVPGWRDYFKNIMKWDYNIGGSYTAALNTTNLDLYILTTQMDTVIG